MAKETLRVVARTIARPDKVEELQSVLVALVEPTRQEAGCILYELMQNQEDPTDFTFIEEWESPAALQAHFETPHFKEAISKLDNLIAMPGDIRRYSVVV